MMTMVDGGGGAGERARKLGKSDNMIGMRGYRQLIYMYK